MEKHKLHQALVTTEAPDLGDKLSKLSGDLSGREFEELRRLVAFLDREDGFTVQDLALLSEKPRRESKSPDFRGIVAESFGTISQQDLREILVIRWRRSLNALLLLDPPSDAAIDTVEPTRRLEIRDLLQSADVPIVVGALMRGNH